ncbi:MAG TPA: hypothetical protein VHZ55_21045 [Bryobacteraceae bacterium]|jgi:hypothetical protein|nr:hypothetical protein [Bryobacteraceae bacterium]
MILNDESTWPDDVLHYLERYHDLFRDGELRGADDTSITTYAEARSIALRYDSAVYGLRDFLNPYTLLGYHCTRLTQREIDHIIATGMQLPNRAMLCSRIQMLQDDGVIDPDVAEKLKANNQADDTNRAGMIWFCFYPPHFAGQGGIESLLGLWGGEALYRSHERDPLIGPILRCTGVPCLIQADVPIASFPIHTFLETHVYRQFLMNRGFNTNECVHHENRATHPIAAKNVRQVIKFPEPEFASLTGCESWSSPLA